MKNISLNLGQINHLIMEEIFTEKDIKLKCKLRTFPACSNKSSEWQLTQLASNRTFVLYMMELISM
jgi:hypothetical protein